MDLIPGILAIVFLFSGFWTFFMARKAASWPSIEAVVERSEIILAPDDDIGAKFEIAYRYSIDDIAYEGERLSFSPTSTYPGYCQKMVDKYPIGSKIRVFYNPFKPEVSTIIVNKVDSGSIMFIIFGLIMSFAAFVIHNKAIQKSLME